MKLRTLHDGCPVVDFPTDQWADYDTLVTRLVEDFGCTKQSDPTTKGHCWLVRDGMRLEAAGDHDLGYQVKATDARAGDFLRVVVGAVLKEGEDRTREAIRRATRLFH